MFSDPVVDNNFFGRIQALQLISKRVAGLKDGYRQNITIIGSKLIGKSSLILRFFSTFTDQQVIPIYVDLTPTSFKHFVDKFIGTLLYRYLKNKYGETFEDYERLKNRAKKDIPKTCEVIDEIENYVKNSQMSHAYEKLLELTAVLKRESNILCIIILDEFHLLNRYKIKSPFRSLAREIMTQKDTMYILLSSQISYTKKILNNELSLLFGNFEVIHLTPFDYHSCCKFLEKRFEDIRLSVDFRDFLIAFSEKRPFYLDILSRKLLEKAKEHNKQEISCELIGRAFNSLIYDSQGILNQYFTNLLTHNLNGTDYSNFLPILLSASSKGCRINDLSKTMNRQPKVISKQINYLVSRDLLTKVGVFYRVQDKIFRFWLKSVYHRKRLSLATDLIAESDDFSREIEAVIKTFTKDSNMNLTDRILSLFFSFNNEIVAIQNKVFKFWQFNEVKIWDLGLVKNCIIARYNDGYWAALVRKDKVTETEIDDFSKICKNSELKIRKTILISLQELDLNTRLAALEKKIWIWSTPDLNLILDLYGKEQIVN